MNKALLTITLALAILLGLGYVLRESIGVAGDAWTTRAMFVSADAANFSPGPAMGSPFPQLNAHHDGRTITSIDEFARGNGTVLVVLRSIDWCPYCKRQMIQLQENEPYFHANGIALVAITYDPPQTQQGFIEQHAITFPVLSDVQSATFRTLGILSDDYQPGDSEYGVPHPGMFIIDRQGSIAGKLFVDTPTLRVDSAEALLYAKRALGLKSSFGNG